MIYILFNDSTGWDKANYDDDFATEADTALDVFNYMKVTLMRFSFGYAN